MEKSGKMPFYSWISQRKLEGNYKRKGGGRYLIRITVKSLDVVTF